MSVRVWGLLSNGHDNVLPDNCENYFGNYVIVSAKASCLGIRIYESTMIQYGNMGDVGEITVRQI